MSSEQPRRPLRRDAQRNRERIIESAREVFAERGVEATLDAVARRAGVGVGTVYGRFPTKGALLRAAFEERLDEHVAEIEAALRAPTGWVGLERFLHRVAEIHATNRGMRDIMLGSDLGQEHFERLRERIFPLVRQLVERAHAEGELREDVTAGDIPMLLMMVSEVAHHSREVRPDAYVRYMRLLIDGLRRSPGTGALGAPLTRSEVDTLTRQWLPAAPSRD
ncbi:TetR/AcrR family transcriptional regulator [Streptomyces phytohabitans]|uniref:TetR/AcrR family transcriptional regulator n=1 Tax=Streptomyces phytohabitans TaxID=1150371 RepID=UPI00345C1C36